MVFNRKWLTEFLLVEGKIRGGIRIVVEGKRWLELAEVMLIVQGFQDLACVAVLPRYIFAINVVVLIFHLLIRIFRIS